MTRISIKGAEKIIRALAAQDCEDDERRAAADAMPGRQIDGWREASVRAGDVLCVQAIDRLGTVRAQRVYDAAREALRGVLRQRRGTTARAETGQYRPTLLRGQIPQ